MEVQNLVQEAMTKTIPKKNKRKKVKYLRNSYNSWEKRETKRKGKRKRYTQLNAEFQKTGETRRPSQMNNAKKQNGKYWRSV